MPGFDGTGPMGQGSLTGRGMGSCGGGRRFGAGRGFGRRGGARGGFWGGMCNWMPSFSASPDQEKEVLKDEIAYLKENLKAFQDRLKDLEKGDK